MVVVVCAAPFAAGEWTQFQGGADRHGSAVMPSGPLDVVANGRIAGSELVLGGMPGLPVVEALEGWATIASDGASCRLLRGAGFDGPTWNATTLPACTDAALGAYSPERDIYLVCHDGDGETGEVQVRGPDGSVRWSVALSVRPPGLQDAENLADVRWDCNDVALDSSESTAYFAGSAWSADEELLRGVVGALNMEDGGVLWRTQLRDGSGGGDPFPAESESDPLAPFRLTVSTTGVTVLGMEILGPPTGGVLGESDDLWRQMFAAWFSTEGIQSGFQRAAPLRTDEVQDSMGASYGAVAAGARSVFRLGADIVVVRGDAPVPLRQEPVEELDLVARGMLGSFTPVLDDDQILVPSVNGIGAFDAQTLEFRWAWAGVGPEWFVWNVVVAERGDILALAYRPVEEPAQVGEVATAAIELVRLDATTGALLQRVPTPAQAWYRERGFGAYPHPVALVPMADRVVLVGQDGQHVTIGVGDDSVPFSLSQAYPARNEGVTVRVPVARENLSEVRVAWGDGAVDVDAPESVVGFGRVVSTDEELVFSHAYRESERHTIAVTLVDADGTTRTSTRTVFVDETPPPELNFMQRQFAPENQDRTWGVIGLVLVAWGALYGLWFRTRRRRRISQELALLDRIDADSVEDPDRALGHLALAQSRLREELTVGHIDDAQYAVLREHAASIARRLQARLVGPYEDRLSASYRGALASAFADGTLSHREAERLRNRLADEKALKPGERKAVRHLLDTWVS